MADLVAADYLIVDYNFLLLIEHKVCFRRVLVAIDFDIAAEHIVFNVI